MKGLLLKDYYVLMKQMKIFLVMIVVFAIMPGTNMSNFAIVYAAMLPITALAYDERAKWDVFAAMMPYSPRDIVLSKYILGYIAVAFAVVLSAAAKVVTGIIQKAPATGADIMPLVIITCLALIIQAVNLPFMFKIGVEKGRLVFFILTAVMVAAVTLCSGIFYDGTLMAKLNGPILYVAAVAVTAIVNVVSIKLSEKFCQNKG